MDLAKIVILADEVYQDLESVNLSRCGHQCFATPFVGQHFSTRQRICVLQAKFDQYQCMLHCLYQYVYILRWFFSGLFHRRVVHELDLPVELFSSSWRQLTPASTAECFRLSIHTFQVLVLWNCMDGVFEFHVHFFGQFPFDVKGVLWRMWIARRSLSLLFVFQKLVPML